MVRRILPWMVALPLLLVGCSTAPVPPAPTSSSVPTASPTPEPTPTPAPSPSPASTPVPTPTFVLRYVFSDGAHLRSSPRHGAEESGTLMRGTPVMETDRDDGWTHVVSDGISGWLPTAHLTDTAPAPIPDHIDSPRIEVRKGDRILILLDGDTAVAAFPIGLGYAPEGHKALEGDGRTPEGDYYVCTRNDSSRFYLSLGLSYPNVEDAAAGLAAGIIGEEDYRRITDAIGRISRPPWDTPLGGAIMIHGYGSTSDWTAGCIAVEDSVMDFLWQHISIGTQVIVLP